MDCGDKLKTTSEWFAKCDSPRDLSIILSVSWKYAESSNTKHIPHQLIELCKVCHEMASFLNMKQIEIIVCGKLARYYYSIARFHDALNYLMESLRICQETGDVAGEGTSYCNIGNVYKSLGQYEKAMEHYKKHLRICQETGNVAGEGGSNSNIGIVYQLLGQYKEAMEYHKKYLRICQETGDVAGEARSYSNIGTVYQLLGQYKEALEYHKKHLRICQETGDVEGEGRSYGNIGIACRLLGQYKEAMEYHKKHLRICQETGDVAGEGTSYGNIGIVYQLLGQYKEALEHHKKHLRICQETGDVAAEGKSYGNIGTVYELLGQYKEALEYHKKHLRICQETGDVAGEGRSYCNIGIVHKSLGQYKEAMEYHKKHLRICQETDDVAGEGGSYGNIGIVYQLLGQYKEAMEYHKKHLRICQETGDVAGEGKSYCNTGNMYLLLGQYKEALEYHKKDLRICQETGDVAGEGRSYCNIGIVYVLLGQYKEALEYHKKDLLICQETGDVAGEGMSYCNTGNACEGLGQNKEAMTYYKKGLSICQVTGDVVEVGKSYWRIGNLCVVVGDIQGAESNLKESLRCFEVVFKLLYKQDDYKVSIVDTYIEAYRLLTNVFIASGKKEEALLVSERGRSQALTDKLTKKYGLQNEEKSVELPIENISSLVSCSNVSFIFLSLSRKKVSIFLIEQGKELYFKERDRHDICFAFCGNSDCSSITLPDTIKCIVDKIIEDANKYINSNQKNVCEDRSMNQDQNMYHDQQLALGDLVSADDVADAIATSEEAAEENATTRIPRYRGEPTEHSDSANSVSEPSSEQTQVKHSELDCGTTPAESKHEGHNKLPIGETFPVEHDGASNGNLTAFKQQDDDQNGDNIFNDLYQVLIAPVQEALTKHDIVIIPDGPLFFVPYAALKEKGQPFLSQTKRIRLGPSLTTLRLLKECPVEKHCKRGALIVGGPITGEVMFRGEKKEFSDLPYARQEAVMIGDILGERPLTGSLATKDEVKKRLQVGVAIIHMATHGKADTGELLLAPGPCVGKEIPEEEDYMLTIKDIYASGINAQLVVLSCCHSGLGQIRAEGVVGLTRAFLAAGARSVLASLWAVNDAATSYFMKHFYQHLKSGESACASLQHAMKEMRKTREWSHPYYWAPFFIVGDDIRITTQD